MSRFFRGNQRIAQISSSRHSLQVAPPLENHVLNDIKREPSLQSKRRRTVFDSDSDEDSDSNGVIVNLSKTTAPSSTGPTTALSVDTQSHPPRSHLHTYAKGVNHHLSSPKHPHHATTAPSSVPIRADENTPRNPTPRRTSSRAASVTSPTRLEYPHTRTIASVHHQERPQPAPYPPAPDPSHPSDKPTDTVMGGMHEQSWEAETAAARVDGHTHKDDYEPSQNSAEFNGTRMYDPAGSSALTLHHATPQTHAIHPQDLQPHLYQLSQVKSLHPNPQWSASTLSSSPSPLTDKPAWRDLDTPHDASIAPAAQRRAHYRPHPVAIAEPPRSIHTQAAPSLMGGERRDLPQGQPGRGSLRMDLLWLLIESLQAQVDEYMHSCPDISPALASSVHAFALTAAPVASLPPFSPTLRLTELVYARPRLAQWLCTATPTRVALTMACVAAEVAQAALRALATLSCGSSSCQRHCLPADTDPHIVAHARNPPGWCRFGRKLALFSFARGHVLLQPVVIGAYDDIPRIAPSLTARLAVQTRANTRQARHSRQYADDTTYRNADGSDYSGHNASDSTHADTSMHPRAYPSRQSLTPSPDPALIPLRNHVRGLLPLSVAPIPTARSLGALVPFVAFITDVFPSMPRVAELPLLSPAQLHLDEHTRAPTDCAEDNALDTPMSLHAWTENGGGADQKLSFGDATRGTGNPVVTVEHPYQYCHALLGADARASHRSCVIFVDAPQLHTLAPHTLIRGTAYVSLDAPEPLPVTAGAPQPCLVLWLTHSEPTAVELLKAPLYLGPDALCPPTSTIFMACDLSVYQHLTRLATDFASSLFGSLPSSNASSAVLVKTRLALMLSLVSAQPSEVIEQTRRSIAEGHLPAELLPYCNPQLNLLNVCIANADEDPLITRLLSFACRFHPRASHLLNPSTKTRPLLGQHEGIVAVTSHGTADADAKFLTGLLSRSQERGPQGDWQLQRSTRGAMEATSGTQIGQRRRARGPSLLAVDGASASGVRAHQCVWVEHRGDAWMGLAHLTTRPVFSATATEAYTHWLLGMDTDPYQFAGNSCSCTQLDNNRVCACVEAACAARGDRLRQGAPARAWERAWLDAQDPNDDAAHGSRITRSDPRDLRHAREIAEEQEWQSVFASSRMLSVSLTTEASELLARYTTAARRVGRLNQREMATITTVALNSARLQLKSQAGVAEVLIGVLFVEESQVALTLSLPKAPSVPTGVYSHNLHLPFTENDVFSLETKYRHGAAAARFKQFYLDVLTFIRNAENKVMVTDEDMFAPF